MEANQNGRRRTRVSLLHSEEYSRVLHDAMGFIHQDRDILLHSLLDYCGFLRNTPKFFAVVAPKKASRVHLEKFHTCDYLDLLESTSSDIPHDLLDSYGLVEDCPLPKERAVRERLWTYCRYIAGASIQGATLLTDDISDVAINWGGGRHHAHPSRAGGFCYVNDIVLAIHRLLRQFHRVLYLDIDIHHADGVQSAFYDSDSVMTVSFHRHASGFFPSDSGSAKEKGKYNTKGMGFNINVPVPRQCDDKQFISIFRASLETMSSAFLPEVVVLCVGADGLHNDALVGQADGWSLSPEGLAECVRLCAENCNSKAACKLLVLGGGGYTPPETARTFLLCTAAACEGPRPGMLWNELPKDMPPHEHFPRYGPEFRLVGQRPSCEPSNEMISSNLVDILKDVKLTGMYISSVREKENRSFAFVQDDNEQIESCERFKGSSRRRRRIRRGGK